MLESRLFVEGYFCIIIIILTLKLDFVIFFNESFSSASSDETKWMRNKCNVKMKLINAKVFMRSKEKKNVYVRLEAYNLQLKSKIVIRRFLLCNCTRNHSIELVLIKNHEMILKEFILWVKFDVFFPSV